MAYYSIGQKLSEENFKDGKYEGLWTQWHENGQKYIEGNYKDGKQEGLHTMWHDNGQKMSEGNYKGEQQEGLWTEWHENGKKSSDGNYKDGYKVGQIISGIPSTDLPVQSLHYEVRMDKDSKYPMVWQHSEIERFSELAHL